jgi:hypothetical protein
MKNVGFRSLLNPPPEAYKTEDAVSKVTGNLKFSFNYPANKMRFILNIVTSGADHTSDGTVKASTVIKKLKMKAVGDKDPVFEWDESTFLQVAAFGLCAVNKNARDVLATTDDTIAENSTYWLEYDVPCALLPGTYTVEYELITAAELSGYTAVPTTFNVGLGFWPIAEGLPVSKNTHVKSAKLYLKTEVDLEDKATSIFCYTANSAVSTNYTEVTFGAPLGATAIATNAREALRRTGLSSGSVTVLYIENAVPSLFTLKSTTAYTFVNVLGW